MPFGLLKSSGLKVKLRKCTFGFLETKFLGYIVSAKGIRMNQDKIDKIVNYPKPTTAKMAKKFNGLSSYFRNFIPNYTKLNHPIQTAALKTKKDPDSKERVSVRFNWTESCKEAVDKLKTLISSAPILIHPDIKKGFRLITDASGVGLGAMLVQLYDTGSERVVSFAGRVLSEAERNYTTGERELLAIRWAVRKLKCYLYGVEFEVHPDHKQIVHIKTSKNNKSIRS